MGVLIGFCIAIIGIGLMLGPADGKHPEICETCLLNKKEES